LQEEEEIGGRTHSIESRAIIEFGRGREKKPKRYEVSGRLKFTQRKGDPLKGVLFFMAQASVGWTDLKGKKRE